MNSWLTHHTQALKLVIARFQQNLFSNLFIALTIAVSLALPMIVYLVLSSFSGLVSTIKSDSHLSLFLKQDATPTMIDSIHNTLATREGLKQFHFISKEDALKQLMIDNNNQDIMSTLTENPLPDAFFIEPASLDSAAIQQLKEDLSQLDGIETVQVDDAWLKRLGYLLVLGKKAIFILALLLGFALFTVIGNTIRMQILTQQEEIEVSQLIGATHSFIRRPFLYSGAIYGLIGALLALIITSIVIWLFNLSVSTLAAEYQTDFSLHLPNFNVFLITCITAISIGLISAYIAVSKSLFKSIN
ncbi:MAG: permease-like cell division protein FtsX [Betaproteobacteria bacterium]|nr:permease-like cell division protein FtsX [Betaproteobacteria bacterium]